MLTKGNWYMVFHCKSDNIKNNPHFDLLKDVTFSMFRILYMILDPFRGEQNNLMWKGIKGLGLSSSFEIP